MDAKYNSKGQQIPDETPVEVPLHMQQPVTQEQKIAAAVSQEISKHMEAQGDETLEQGMDFEVEDENDPLEDSQYTIQDMQEDPEPLMTYEQFEEKWNAEQETKAKEKAEQEERGKKVTTDNDGASSS